MFLHLFKDICYRIVIWNDLNYKKGIKNYTENKTLTKITFKIELLKLSNNIMNKEPK